jgi:hypothetical protein
MTCRICEDLLQQQLDGGPALLEQHLHVCPDCAGQAALLRRLIEALPRLTPPAPPAGLADRLARGLLAEARVRRRRLLRRRAVAFAGLAAAAGLLVALGVWAWQPGPVNPDQPGPVAVVPGVRPPDAPDERAAPLRDSVAQAGQAVAALTSRTASDTIDQTASLLPFVGGSGLEPLSNVPAPLEPPLEPLREAADGVGAGLAPVADSARRAVGLFFRDLPMGQAERSGS